MFDVAKVRKDFPILEEQYTENAWYTWIMGRRLSGRCKSLKK